MPNQTDALARRALEGQWQGDSAERGLTGQADRGSDALHPDDIASRRGTVRRRPAPQQGSGIAATLAMMPSLAFIVGLAAVVAVAGLALWSSGAFQASVNAFDDGVTWVQDRTLAADDGVEQGIVADRVSGSYEAEVAATDGRGVRADQDHRCFCSRVRRRTPVVEKRVRNPRLWRGRLHRGTHPRAVVLGPCSRSVRVGFNSGLAYPPVARTVTVIVCSQSGSRTQAQSEGVGVTLALRQQSA